MRSCLVYNAPHSAVLQTEVETQREEEGKHWDSWQ